MIDIIIPVYNVENYLAQCVESVLCQPYTDFHIILVDDGSSDNSGTICDWYAIKDKRISVVHKKNGGLSSARNAGIDCSAGDYLLFLDSDDTLTNNALQILFDAITESAADAVFGGYNLVDEKGIIQQTLTVPEQVLTGDRRFTIIYQETYLVMSHGKLFHKRLLEGFRFQVGKLHEDVFAYHELIYKANVVYCIEQPIINYLQRSDGITGKKFMMKNLDAVDALFERATFFTERGLAKCESQTMQYIYKYLIFIIHKIDFQNSEMALKYKWYYAKWKEISHQSHDKEFKALCFLYYYHICKKSFLSYNVFQLIRRGRMLMKARKVVFKLLVTRCLKSRFILISTPVHGNLGDQAIVFAQRQMLKDCGINHIVEINSVDYLRYRSVIVRLITPKDVVIIDGGGNIGSLWPTEAERINDIVKRFKGNHIIIFPETAFYSDDVLGRIVYKITKSAFEKHKNLYVFLRDKPSFKCIKQMLQKGNVYLCPDIAIYLKGRIQIDDVTRKGVLLCIRNDIERSIDEMIINQIIEIFGKQGLPFYQSDTVIKRCVTPHTRKKELYCKWKEFTSSQLVITDRLHGMLFAYITNTPCIAFNNINGKVEAQYSWIQSEDYIGVCNDISKIEKMMTKLISINTECDSGNRADFSQLRGIIQNAKNH